MSRFTIILFVFLAIGDCLPVVLATAQCAGNGFTGGCECNIIGACVNGVPRSGLSASLAGYSPSGIEQFAYNSRTGRSLAYVCEGNTVATLFDCNARIPLYSATVMTGQQLNAGYSRPNVPFSPSTKLDRQFQQQDDDFDQANQRNICYEKASQRYDVDSAWLQSHPKKPRTSPTTPQPCTGNFNLKSPMHKGHLIAASYGRGDNNRITATFTYTNSVPQFGAFNSGAWCKSERDLLIWAQNNCNTVNNPQKTRMYIVVGAIPSTFPSLHPRFFGKAGFSDYPGYSRLLNTYGANTGGHGARSGPNSYRVNVPRFMWTAACCTFEQKVNNKVVAGTRSTAFYRENDPGKSPCNDIVPAGDLNLLFTFLTARLGPINVFPSERSCYNSANFVKLL